MKQELKIFDHLYLSEKILILNSVECFRSILSIINILIIQQLLHASTI